MRASPKTATGPDNLSSRAKRARKPRKTNPNAPPVAERVATIRALMAKGQWHGLVSRMALAQKWGVSDVAVRTHAAEASRNLALDPEELEAQKAVHALFAERIMRRSIRARDKRTGQPDWKAALEANRDAAKFRGIDIEGKRRVELTGPDGKPLDATGGLAALFAAPELTAPAPASEEVDDEAGSESGPAAP